MKCCFSRPTYENNTCLIATKQLTPIVVTKNSDKSPGCAQNFSFLHEVHTELTGFRHTGQHL